MSTFKYETVPVDSEKREIRVLHILPLDQDSIRTPLTDPVQLRSTFSTNSAEARVTCTLTKVSLNDIPKYLALSYTWGSEIFKTIDIASLDGQRKNTIEVRANLEEVLRYLRQENNPVCIWIDALCINQADEIEKTEQVVLMRDIYRQCTSAVVWLGPAAEDSDKAMESLDRIGKKAEDAGMLNIRKEHIINWPRPDPEGCRNADQKALDDLPVQAAIDFPHEAFKMLSQRTYWTRVWIVQEIALPTKVVILCGHKKLSFSHFTAGFLFLALKRGIVLRTITAADLSDPVRGATLETMIGHYPHPSLGILIGARRKCQNEREGDGPETLMELLMRGCVVVTKKDQDRQCTDPRDKIYGLLGLASDADHIGVKADYKKDVVQGYTHVARKLIMNGYMDILSWCQKPDDPNQEPKKEMKGLPSWVPDFSSPVRDPCGEPQKFKLFLASGSRGVSCLPTNTIYPNRLSLAGMRIDTIKQTGTHWAPGLSCDFNYVVAKQFISDIDDFCNDSRTQSSNASLDAESCEEAKWRIPCFDQIFTTYSRRKRTKTSPNAIEGYRELRQRIDMYPDVGDEFQSQPCQAYLIAMEYLHNRKPFISSQGYVGLVPAHSMPGDIVCILFGADVPFVLRDAENGEYKLIGEAYVFGIMDGEFVKGDPREEMFCLC